MAYKNSSSKTNGRATAMENGHPTSAPVAKDIVARSVRRIFVLVVGSRKYAKPMQLRYMANEEGRKAVFKSGGYSYGKCYTQLTN